jgi:hypothetical protein
MITVRRITANVLGTACIFPAGRVKFLWHEKFLEAGLRQIRLIAAATLRQAEQQIESCEHCHDEMPKFRSTGF